ncbi:MAG: hypothetical protein JJ974_02695 [Phycisphaerales bacterium]|nr:hypothetical protein [Phycisphaerales bacterium]
MQSDLFEPSNLPELEQAGSLTRYLFESPMIAIAVAILLGVLLLFAMRSRGKDGTGLIVLACSILVAAGIFILSSVVTTDREMLALRAGELVDAVALGDEDSMQSLMDEGVVVETRFANARGRADVIALASNRVPRIVDEYAVREVRADLPGPRVARTMVKVRASGKVFPASSSWWMIHWERTTTESDDWEAVLVRPVWIQGIPDPAG